MPITAIPESPEEIQQLKARIWDSMHQESRAVVMRSAFDDVAEPRPVVVAEGDSWFDYAPGLDILDFLKGDYGYDIHKFASGGDTIVNMAWGTGIRRNFAEVPSQFILTQQAIRKHQPRFLLLSGGGNDIAGDEFAAFLNHRDSGLEPFRQAYAEHVIGVFERAYRHIIDSALKIKPDLHVLVHGYANPVPNGTAVLNFPLGFRFVGPWLRPSLARNRLDFSTTGREVIRRLIGMHNDMLEGLTAKYPGRLHYIDLRSDFDEDDWVNELHLKNRAFQRAAARFHERMKALM
jgi:hypothetical protein